MHESGIVEVQSQSLHLGLVFTSDRPCGFSTPAGPFPIAGSVPLVIRNNGRDVAERRLALGTPLYKWEPALAALRRFIANPKTKERCVQLVAVNGGKEFFSNIGWRDALLEVVDEAETGYWESEDDRRERFRIDLLSAKLNIEERLPGAKVRVIAPPWGAMHRDLPGIAHETGHELIVMAYPFPKLRMDSPLPLYPRLFGDSIWTLLRGPLRGGKDWWLARRRNIARRSRGAIP